MTPTTIDEAAERAVFQSHWCPPDYDETPGFEVHKQFAINAWLARARIAAQREAELSEKIGELRRDAERLAQEMRDLIMGGGYDLMINSRWTLAGHMVRFSDRIAAIAQEKGT